MKSKRQPSLSFFLLAGLSITLAPSAALAYVGPGAGLGLLGAFFMLLAGVLLAVVMTLLHPIKAMLRKMRGENIAGEEGEGAPKEEVNPDKPEESASKE